MSDTTPTSHASALIRRATRDESSAVAGVIRDGFKTVADAIGQDIPPLHETAADVEETFDAGDAVLVAESDGRLVGTVRAESLEGGGVMVRRLAVLPEVRGRGVARSLMRALEDAYPDAPRFELFTGAMATGPIALYESLGYKLIEPREEMGFPLVWFEKCR
ncbi:MAG: GNAT family N-acetyltransferase [Coriobacteriia bacterium]|nr:GNAT family N-acetyltransferase [Coriobacteriia bacterium]